MANRIKREIMFCGNIAYVPLTRGHVAMIDASDAHLVSGYNWTALPAPNTVYAHRFERRGGKRIAIYMHRVIGGAASGIQIDHVDRNGLNNRRANLRKASGSENLRNRSRQRNNTSGFKGVSWSDRDKAFEARICVQRQSHYLGLFKTAQEAYAAYCEAAARLHGEFARVT